MEILFFFLPLLLTAVAVEIYVDRRRRTRYIRLGNAINSMSLAMLVYTTKIFSQVVAIGGFVWLGQTLAPRPIPVEAFNFTSVSGIAAILAVWLAWDFGIYWRHRLRHEWAFLWAHHYVHHQSEEYNLTTAFRGSGIGVLFTLIVHLPILLAGVPPQIYLPVGAFINLVQYFAHTRHVGRLGLLDEIFMTPSNHRVHHARNDVYIDKNYGGMLIIWDKLFGTYQRELSGEAVVFGIKKPVRTWNPFVLTLHAYAQLFRDAWYTRGWRNKLGVFLARTGERPADVSERFPAPAVSDEEFTKFDPETTPTLQRYAVFQFIAGIGATIALLGFGKHLSLSELFVLCLPVWMLLYTVGGLLEGQRLAVRIEALRLGLLAAGASIAAAFGLRDPASVLLVAAAYIAISCIWLVSSAKVAVARKPFTGSIGSLQS